MRVIQVCRLPVEALSPVLFFEGSLGTPTWACLATLPFCSGNTMPSPCVENNMEGIDTTKGWCYSSGNWDAHHQAGSVYRRRAARRPSIHRTALPPLFGGKPRSVGQTLPPHGTALASFRQSLVPGWAGDLETEPERVPRLDEVNLLLARRTGFEAKAVSGYVPSYQFFECLRKREFPTTITVRPADSLDYLPEPDIFHDIAGHVPMHTDPAFAEALVQFGRCARAAEETVAGLRNEPAKRSAWSLSCVEWLVSFGSRSNSG